MTSPKIMFKSMVKRELDRLNNPTKIIPVVQLKLKGFTDDEILLISKGKLSPIINLDNPPPTLPSLSLRRNRKLKFNPFNPR